jgi:predicted nucleotide-binding protein (sugar kinase/HSP70/actin superfamily)
VRNEILPLLSYMIRINEAMYKDLSTWILKSPNDKLKNLKHMSFKKKAKDFVSLENYSKYKQREMKKMRNNITKETETDIKNIKRWLSNEKKNAKWKK